MVEELELSPVEAKEFVEAFERDKENILRVVEELQEKGIEEKIVFHGKSGSARESAEKTGFHLSRIVKSLVFKTRQGEALLVLSPGDSRIDEGKLEEEIGKKVDMADPEKVEEETGYRIGGVSPFDLEIPVYMEESLMDKNTVKPAAGSKITGVEIEPGKLARHVDARILNLT